MPVTLAELIADELVHVLDGAMGTELYSRGVFVNVCYDELNLVRPELVQGVHQEYVQAGAEVLETNTFGANPVKLSSFGLEDRTEEINRAAAELARHASGGAASVVGAIGPLGIRIEPYGPTAFGEAVEFYVRQAEGLLEGGVDGFILETFSDLKELEAALEAVRRLSDLPVIAQMTVSESGSTSYGTTVETLGQTLDGLGPEVVGLNCSVGPAGLLDCVERLAAVTERSIAVQPNAGIPRTVGDRKMYLASPEYMARYAGRMIEAGARFIGGCCGTTPQHIARIRREIRSLQPRSRPMTSPRGGDTVEVREVPLATRSRLAAKLDAGGFVTTVEVVPPRGWQTRDMVEHCRRLARTGIDAITVVDSPRARSRMGAIAASQVIQRELPVETTVHYRCRDRNMLGMISDLLGAHATGLRNLILVTGDPPVMGPYGDSSAVIDIDSIGLTNVVHQLNRGLDPGGNRLDEPTEFVIGVVMNQSAIDLEREQDRFYWKVDAGASFAVTQPVFDVDALLGFLDAATAPPVPVIAGIVPLASLHSAEYLANEVPGIHVPEEVISRMRAADDSGTAAEEGLAIAVEIFSALRERVQGVHVSTPGGDPARALELLRQLGVHGPI